MRELLVNILISTVIVIVGLTLMVVMILRKRRFKVEVVQHWPFHVKRPLSTPEQILYHRLVKALPDHIILAQVQVSRVLGVNKGFNFHEWNNRINRLSYDFVVCGKDAAVLAVIELDDKSHERAGRGDADRKKDRATEAAGVHMIRWHVKALPDQATIQAIITSQPVRLKSILKSVGD
ncbi:DUF2726 domain-containing protein [Nitrosovibrio sp. Nv17]|uniref:DUF2726 domain-containing protein n=1 Tax=Nitrosovibrio sp. Nv17 TaxID=1855339 RepID=UPI0009317031|nr:DUF2726 domain-containing protein [Nitrosovibrio sp. Nv17]